MLNYHKYNFCGNSIFQKQFLTKLNYASISKLENNLKGFEEALSHSFKFNCSTKL